MMRTADTKLPIKTRVAIAKHKLDAAFALELEHDRERMLEDGLGFDTIDALIDEQIVQYLACSAQRAPGGAAGTVWLSATGAAFTKIKRA
jgi:hypothetical protein